MEYTYESHIEYINQANPMRIKITHSHRDGYIHWHENMELLFFLEGGCSVFTGESDIPVNTGDLIALPPGIVHGTKCKENPGTYICVIVDQDFMESLGFCTNMVNIERKIVDDDIKAIFKKIEKDMQDNSEYSKSSTWVSVLSVILILFQKYSAPCDREHVDTAKIQLVKKTIRYIREHYAENLSVTDIANHCGYTKHYLCRTFKEITGTSIIYYLHNMRINEAKLMVTKGDMSMSEIALRYGFSSSSYFGKIFKKMLGCSPLEYKQKNQAIK